MRAARAWGWMSAALLLAAGGTEMAGGAQEFAIQSFKGPVVLQQIPASLKFRPSVAF